MAIKLFYCVMHDGSAESQRFTDLDMRHFANDYRSIFNITLVDDTPCAAEIKVGNPDDHRRATEFAQYALAD